MCSCSKTIYIYIHARNYMSSPCKGMVGALYSSLPSQLDGDTLWWGRAGTQNHARSPGRAESLARAVRHPN